MDWGDIGRFISGAAPILGSVVGGPVGAAAGGAVALIAKAFGCEADPEQVMKAIQADPKAMIRLKELEVENEANLLAWQTAQVQAEVDDRKSARKASVDGGDRVILLILSVIILCAVGYAEHLVLTVGFPATLSGEMGGRILGFFEGIATTIVCFWFGMAHTSRTTAGMLYNSTPTK